MTNVVTAATTVTAARIREVPEKTLLTAVPLGTGMAAGQLLRVSLTSGFLGQQRKRRSWLAPATQFG
jgi:hypothetical protein